MLLYSSSLDAGRRIAHDVVLVNCHRFRERRDGGKGNERTKGDVENRKIVDELERMYRLQANGMEQRTKNGPSLKCQEKWSCPKG
jgi:hypothetical protein